VCASIFWASGSVYSKHAKQAPDVLLAVAMQMLTGFVWVSLASVLAGEWHRFEPAAITSHTIGAWLYLTLAGSLAAFSAYIYILKVSTPARVGTYAYV